MRRPSSQAAPPSVAPGATPPPARAPAPIAKVTKLASPEQRKQLADSIASAQAARSANPPSSTGTPSTRARQAPSLPAEAVEANDRETLKVELRAAMKEIVPMLAECYEAEMDSIPEAQTKIVAELTLTGDPDVGTLIDAKQLATDEGKPLSTRFDDCLRGNLQLLALPPLAEGDRVEVRYPFLFAKQ